MGIDQDANLIRAHERLQEPSILYEILDPQPTLTLTRNTDDCTTDAVEYLFLKEPNLLKSITKPHLRTQSSSRAIKQYSTFR